jgi:hypothetical protein
MSARALVRIPRLLILWTMVPLLISGCGGATKDSPKLYRVTGTVKYKGTAVPGAKVMFLGDGKSPPAVGVTDDSGRFSLSSLSGTGAVAGKHQVAIIKNAAPEEAAPANLSMEAAAAEARKPAKKAATASLVPAKYASGGSSGLEYEVKASGANDFAIDLVD